MIFLGNVMKDLKSQLEYSFSSMAEMRNWFQTFIQEFSEKQILLLQGSMGVGKTHLVKWLCEYYGLNANSPTFAIHQLYENENISIDHFDLFRLKNEADLESTGFWDVFSKPHGIVAIEWAEKIIPQMLPHNWSLLKIEISKVDKGESRKVTIYKER